MMKKCILGLMVFGAACGFAVDMTPQKFRNITPDTTMYNSQQTDVLVSNAGKVQKIVAGNNITISPASGEGTVTINSTGGGAAASKKIAMFIIPMNTTSSSSVSTSFKHFELKASTNNFNNALASDKRVVYYTHSGYANTFNVTENDKAKIYVNHGGADKRSYVKVYNTLEYLTSYAPESYIVLVDVSQCWPTRSDGGWLESENNNLIWTYVKTKNGSRETDAGSSDPLWRPIQPVKWFSELPTWAN